MRQREPSASESYYWPTVWAVALHVLIFGMLFASFAMTPELPEAKPIVQATLYQLKSRSQATQQTNQKLAGEAKKSAARQTEVEQMEQKKVEQEEIKAAVEQKKADAAQKAEQAKAADEAKKAEAAAKAEDARKADDAKKADQAKADEAKKVAEAKKAEQADLAKKKADEEAKKEAAEEAKQAAEDAKKQAADDAKKKAAEDAKKQAADDAKKKAAEEAKAAAAADAKKKAAEDAKKTADAAKKKAQDAARKSAEDKKAQALADLLSDKPQRQQALAEEQGDETAGNFDDLIRSRAAESWARPPSARKGMTVQLQINMLPDGTVTSVKVIKSSNDGPFDASAVAAIKNIGRLTEMQGLKPNEFAPYRSFKMTFTPEDLAL
jgi:colicin import membrane protein